jgi:hypothetical protein
VARVIDAPAAAVVALRTARLTDAVRALTPAVSAATLALPNLAEQPGTGLIA